ncbi:RsmB/NOP family class I SAM-dependent RNA methyltransferase [Hydrogenimonas cancrithermarum]|uniref:rRNA cytosine-C5-methyltransferase n=1 Tax=Hydrogenimonas cancrithermarum TaxID=2993563 RepID=A0ABM8FPT4_9BACT|nr:RsmB/NOP family class I SAM-dependent RNA methyltransferase [Hydrogenimonas cancrithermarum]BDY13823.1 rRNA cytosine-C5-methyltransferase [Hydrogenimonas cancrithermarum]
MPLPDLFIERFRAIYPDDADTLLETFERPRRVSFRINPLKTDTDTALKQLDEEGLEPEPVAWYPYAFSVEAKMRDTLTHSRLFDRGDIYIQSLSSMLAPLILGPRPGETVLDLTAAPGGKSLMMAAMMQNEGWLSVVEPGKDRFFRLKANLERGGATIAHHYMADGRGVGNKCPAMFDRVLLDAPCSTEAKFKTYAPQTYAFWSERKIKEMAKLQYRLMESAIKSLKPGGKLLYATCSFAPEENEAVVDKALHKHPEIHVEPIEIPIENIHPGVTQWKKKRFNLNLSKAVRILPTESMDGFFLCLLKKV